MALRRQDAFIAHPCGLLRKHLAPPRDHPPWASPFHGGQRL